MPRIIADGGHVWAAVFAVVITGFLYFLTKLYAAREKIWKMQRADLVRYHQIPTVRTPSELQYSQCPDFRS